GFYLGEFFKVLEEEEIFVEDKLNLAASLVRESKKEPIAHFGEGWWIDHWRYNLDLIEIFLYFYPDKIKELFLRNEYYFWDDEYRVKLRKQRYCLKDGKVYQLNSIEVSQEKKAIILRRTRYKNFLRTKSNRIYKTNLIVKLFSLILNKISSQDPEGIGVEMEADKPGWCDSLNGLPALFGSSLCETLEIKRATLILLDTLKYLEAKKIKYVLFPVELAQFLNSIKIILDKYFSLPEKTRDFFWWEKANSIKEAFRNKTFFNIDGKERALNIKFLQKFLNRLLDKLNIGIYKAKDKKTNSYITYFTYKATKFSQNKNIIKPLKFKMHPLPLFLESFVGALRVQEDEKIYETVKKSALFDRKLKMYRLNESLKDESLEIGRIKIFPSGWLENESIWLHMEYKYLLELLKKGLYDKFYEDFFNCAVCFLNPEIYGRSILENSSFIVSSAHIDTKLWGRGFVARLTGATVEFLHIWMLLCLGNKPFWVDEKNRLFIQFSPILKECLFTTKPTAINFKGEAITLEENTFAFSLFSNILVVYHNPKRKDTFSLNKADYVKIKKITIQLDNQIHKIESNIIEPPFSYKIREVKAKRIDLYLE
ncbi:MAG: hypothetical protein NC925_04735, partial [Candidatus Omnitrophica bacterium]|nr:hypothetical protein [Candidatus Omnitrophota bacterium]